MSRSIIVSCAMLVSLTLSPVHAAPNVRDEIRIGPLQLGRTSEAETHKLLGPAAEEGKRPDQGLRYTNRAGTVQLAMQFFDDGIYSLDLRRVHGAPGAAVTAAPIGSWTTNHHLGLGVSRSAIINALGQPDRQTREGGATLLHYDTAAKAAGGENVYHLVNGEVVEIELSAGEP